MPKISIIIPVYNVEDYIGKCIESLVNQTFKDIEIIVVNDGSTDNSQKEIEKFTSDKRVKLFNIKNSGVSEARNYGLSKASGDYIGFVDSDDYVDPNMYEEMYKKAISEDFDCVVCDLDLVYPDKSVRSSCGIKKDCFNTKVIMNKIYPTVWNKIYKKELLKNLKFKKNVWFEDVEFIYKIMPKIKSLGYVNKNYYKYLQRNNSISKTYDKRLYDYIDNWNGLVDYYKKNKYFDKYKKEIEYSYVRYLYATFVKQTTNFNKKDYKEAVNCAIKNVKSNFPHYRRNKYFYKSFKGIYMVLFNRVVANILYFVKHK